MFFDVPNNMGDEESVLVSQEDHFQKLNTVPIVSVPLILGVFLEIIGIVFLSLWPKEQNKCDTYFIYLYLHCAYWLTIVLTDHLVKAKHHKLRIYGYFKFYQSTYQHIRAPLYVASFWIMCYLLLAAILHHTHKVNYEQYCRASEWFTPMNYVLLLTTIELTIIIPVYINYIKRVLRFNQLHPLPDITEEEWLSSFNQFTFAGSSEVGYRRTESNVEDLLEKQADLIRYLRDHHDALCYRIMM